MLFDQMNRNNSEKLSECQTIFYNLKEDEPEFEFNSLMFRNDLRTNMVQWLVFLCDKLNFDTQTLFRSVIIFDKYISLSNIFYSKNEEEVTQEKLNLITIACLSLATKMEEINCNYVSFFVEKVLNLPNYQIFSVKDLTKMEMTILKELKYKTLYSTAFDFLQVYLELFKNVFLANEQMCQNIKILSENLLKQNIINDFFVTMTQSDFAMLCFTQVLVQMGMNQYLIVKEFNALLNNTNDLLNKNSMDNIINDSKGKYKRINMMVSPIQNL